MIDYLDNKELHTGIKQRCRKLHRQAKAMVTKLAPGAFSPKQPPAIFANSRATGKRNAGRG
jgi:hypothetical protein